MNQFILLDQSCRPFAMKNHASSLELPPYLVLKNLDQPPCKVQGMSNCVSNNRNKRIPLPHVFFV